MIFISAVLILLTALWVPTSAHAIIILAPLIIIPVVKLVVLIVAIVTAPTSILTGVMVYLQKPKTKREFVMRVCVITCVSLAVIALLTVLISKLIHPDRPWF